MLFLRELKRNVPITDGSGTSDAMRVWEPKFPTLTQYVF